MEAIRFQQSLVEANSGTSHPQGACPASHSHRAGVGANGKQVMGDTHYRPSLGGLKVRDKSGTTQAMKHNSVSETNL